MFASSNLMIQVLIHNVERQKSEPCAWGPAVGCVGVFSLIVINFIKFLLDARPLIHLHPNFRYLHFLSCLMVGFHQTFTKNFESKILILAGIIISSGLRRFIFISFGVLASIFAYSKLKAFRKRKSK